MSTMTGSASYDVFNLRMRDRWNGVLKKFSAFDDVCFKSEYCELYENEHALAEAFCYQDQGEAFLIAYLKRAVPDSEYFDFETVYGYGGVLATTREKGFLKEAWLRFHDYCANNNIIAGFMRFNPLFDNHLFADLDCVQIVKDRDVVVLTLDGKDEEEVLSRYAGSNRNKIRLAMRSGVNIRNARSAESLFVFKNMYYRTMERLGAEEFYYFGNDFFEKIEKLLKDNYTVFLASKDDTPIGGAITFLTKKVIYYFLSATTDEGRKLGAANLLRHKAVKFAIENRIKFINFGGGRSADKNDALFKFKKGFSSETRPFYIGKFIVNQPVYLKFCEEWLKNSPKEKIEKYGKRFLKYRS